MNSISSDDQPRFAKKSKGRIMKKCLRCGKSIIVPSNTDKSYCSGNCQALNYLAGVRVRGRKKMPHKPWDDEMNERWDKAMKGPEGPKLLLTLIRKKR